MNSLVNYFNAWGHIQYEQLKDRLNASKNLDLDTDQKQYLKELNTNGVVVLSDYYSHEKCEAIIKEINRLVAKTFNQIYFNVKLLVCNFLSKNVENIFSII